MNFHEVRFPENLSFGSVGGPERRTEIVTLSNGFEERNTPWKLFGFRWKDWTDYKSSAPSTEVSPMDQAIGSGDGAAITFQLEKKYLSGAQAYARPVKKPVEGTVRVAVDGNELAIGIDFTVDETQGALLFGVAPANGASITAGFEFDVPVRFDTDRIDSSLGGFSAGEVPSVPIVEVRV